MPDYSESKIYKIECLNDPDSLIYIGATTTTLKNRLGKHKNNYKAWKAGKYHFVSSFELFEKYGIDDVVITLLDEVDCENKDELTASEREWVRALDCVNKHEPGRTNKEYREDNKEKLKEKARMYREENKEEVKKRKHAYYEKNKEIITEKNKIRVETNKEEHLKRRRELREANKEKINARRKELYHLKKEILAMMMILI